MIQALVGLALGAHLFLGGAQRGLGRVDGRVVLQRQGDQVVQLRRVIDLPPLRRHVGAFDQCWRNRGGAAVAGP